MLQDTGLGDFLLARRRMADPRRAASPSSRTRRRPGLRREEIAALAGVSADYYARLEQGRQTSASQSVLMSIADALDLDAVERRHMLNLARAATARHRPEAHAQSARPALVHLMDTLGTAPAIVHGRGADVLAVNDAFRATVTDFYAKPVDQRNVTRWMFLDEESRIFEEWAAVAGDIVGILRQELGRFPWDPRLTSLANDLSEQSEPFRAMWAGCRVTARLPSRKVIRHSTGATLEFEVEGVSSPTDLDQMLYVFMAKDARTASAVPRLTEEWRRRSGGARVLTPAGRRGAVPSGPAVRTAGPAQGPPSR